jgi:type 2 lantibiotic biosynthesis protein LanM
MLRAYEQGKTSLDARMSVVEQRFWEEGIRLEQPFLNRGSDDCFDVQFARVDSTVRQHLSDTVSDPNIREDAFLQTAIEIGARLYDEAVWYQGRCNWIGAGADAHLLSAPHAKMYSALGTELYAGTSGVALFLAELYKATGDIKIRRTALGALRQALSRVDDIPPPARLGLFSGWIGISFAAARAGVVLGEDELLGNSAELLRRVTHESQAEDAFDLITGRAGAIAALITLRTILGDASLVDLAVQFGNDLIESADKSEAGYSWKAPAFPKQRNLTGFSHGTAGVGYALLELFHATGGSEFRWAAEQAFTYERHWFDATVGNWPDFREEPKQRKDALPPFSFATAWCHGAPGIALSRLRAYEILNRLNYKIEAITAIQTTQEMIKAAFQSDTENYSLCHGLAGNAEALVYGNQVLGNGIVECSLTQDVGHRGIAACASHGGRWLCGTSGGETPGFMIGLAGIGYYYLRLYNPNIPTLLILRPEEF